jgi:heme o synthase
MLKTYYYLTKPGIVRANAMTAAAGFLLAAQQHIVNLTLMLAAVAGIALVIASACVINNYIDRSIDRRMARTKNRALVTGRVSVRNAMIYAAVLGLSGMALLVFGTNPVAAWVTLTGVFFYLVMYSIGKRRSVYGTIIGSVSGAVPIVAGYAAATGRIDVGAILLFFIMVTWQMPHFYAIGIYRSDDYASAGLPVLPVKSGFHTAKIHMLVYIILFLVAITLLTAFGYTGYTYLAVMLLLGLRWLQLAINGLKAKDDKLWARRLFGFSLIVLLGFSLMISIDIALP